MKIIIMGCGRVGSQVSLLLAERGHDVTVIDHRDTDALVRLGVTSRAGSSMASVLTRKS